MTLNQTFTHFFITHLTNSVDLYMNDFCYECSQDGAYLNSFDSGFAHKETRCTNITEKKTDCNMQRKNYHYEVT